MNKKLIAVGAVVTAGYVVLGGIGYNMINNRDKTITQQKNQIATRDESIKKMEIDLSDITKTRDNLKDEKATLETEKKKLEAQKTEITETARVAVLAFARMGAAFKLLDNIIAVEDESTRSIIGWLDENAVYYGDNKYTAYNYFQSWYSTHAKTVSQYKNLKSDMVDDLKLVEAILK